MAGRGTCSSKRPKGGLVMLRKHQATHRGTTPHNRPIFTCEVCDFEAVLHEQRGLVVVADGDGADHDCGFGQLPTEEKCVGCGGRAQAVWTRSKKPKRVCMFCLMAAMRIGDRVDLNKPTGWAIVGINGRSYRWAAAGAEVGSLDEETLQQRSEGAL